MDKLLTNIDRSRKVACILYPSAENYDCEEVLEQMKAFAKAGECVMLWILHDKDLDESGAIKKPHYHVAFKFTNRRYISSLRKQFTKLPADVPFIDIDDFAFYVLYMLHYENGGQDEA